MMEGVWGRHLKVGIIHQELAIHGKWHLQPHGLRRSWTKVVKDGQRWSKICKVLQVSSLQVEAALSLGHGKYLNWTEVSFSVRANGQRANLHQHTFAPQASSLRQLVLLLHLSHPRGLIESDWLSVRVSCWCHSHGSQPGPSCGQFHNSSGKDPPNWNLSILVQYGWAGAAVHSLSSKMET